MPNKNIMLLYIVISYYSMTNFMSFFMGACSGVYLAQNYDIPDVKNIGNQIMLYVNSLEKKDEAKKPDDK
jgi:hypothetical protein